MSKAVIKTLENVVAVQILFPIWSARKTLNATDLKLGDAPDKDLISLGSKFTTNPKALKVFSTLKRRAERLCQKFGVSFMGGYAIPFEKADFISEGLNEIVAEFQREKAIYLQNHAEIQSKWLDQWPEFRGVLEREQITADQVSGRISATFSMFKLQPMGDGLSSGLEEQVDQLSSTLDSDILKEANKLLSSLNSAIKPSKTNVKGLTKLKDKVEGLAFLNGKYKKLTDEISKVENQIGASYSLSFDDQTKLSGLLYRMTTPDRLNELMEQVNANNTPASSMADQDSIDDFDFDFEIGKPEKETKPTESVFF